MKSRLALIASCAITLAAPVDAQVYTSPGEFAAAAGIPTYTETFESVPVPKNVRVPSFTQAGITYYGQNNGQFAPNVVVTPPGATEYGPGLNPTSTSILTSSGNENIVILFQTAAYAVGFDTYYNGLGTATATFYNGATILGSISYSAAAALGFNGYIATNEAPVTSMHWLATGGYSIDTGIDNLSINTNEAIGTPEPGTLVLFATGLGALSAFRRRRNG